MTHLSQFKPPLSFDPRILAQTIIGRSYVSSAIIYFELSSKMHRTVTKLQCTTNKIQPNRKRKWKIAIVLKKGKRLEMSLSFENLAQLEEAYVLGK